MKNITLGKAKPHYFAFNRCILQIFLIESIALLFNSSICKLFSFFFVSL